jgi:hypothetical protein
MINETVGAFYDRETGMPHASVLHLVMLRKSFSVLSIEINKVDNAMMIVEYAEWRSSREQRRGQLARPILSAFKKEIIERCV